MPEKPTTILEHFSTLTDPRIFLKTNLHYLRYERNRYAVALEPLRPMDLPLRCYFFSFDVFSNLWDTYRYA